MKMVKVKYIFIVMSILLLSSLFVNAQEPLKLPANMLLVQKDNEQRAEIFLGKISFFIAFFAGMLSLISPCILPLLPAFFSYTFKEKKKITKMTLFFSLGFSIVFVILGLLAASVGASLVTYQNNISTLILFGGVLLIIFGLMSLFGKGFSGFIKLKHKPKHDVFGVFLMGILFAVGWSACLGAVLFGILSIAAVSAKFAYAGLLLFSYSLGIAVPLFILSFFYDKYNLGDSKFIKGKKLDIFGWKVHSSNLISGLMLIFVGIIFVIYRGTSILNNLNPFKSLYFYTLNSKFVDISYINIAGIIVFIVFIALLIWFLRRGKKNAED